MKKLVMTMVIFCVAVFAQAASVTWTTANIQGTDVITPVAGWYVELYDAAVTYDYAKAKNGEIVATDFTTTIAHPTNGSIQFSKSYNGGYSANEAFSFYAVIYDADSVAGAQHYIVSDVKSGKIAASGADGNLTFGNMALTVTANTWRNSEWQSVPEPTSGLLLLVGGALLALRRKQK